MTDGIQRWTVTEPYLDIRGGLLEGPFYTPARNELRFVDIDKAKVYFVDLAKGPSSLRVVSTGVAVGVTADVVDADAKDQVIVAAKHGFATLDSQTGELSYVRRIWDNPDDEHKMRFNDGAVDSRGRFWAGSCNDDKVTQVKDEGTMFRLDPDRTVHRMVERMMIPNGTGWNSKDDTMYLTDSPRGDIYAYDFNAETGDISNRRVHFHLDGSIGEPDGFAMDVEDCIWIAVWRGSKVIRINPEGKIIGEISLPTRHVTCPEFVGTELFITTAAEKEPEKYPESARYGGNVYRVDVGVRGKPRNSFHFKK
ncbi:hypothetical protein VTN96DRAFT_3757 [Rasamsonia emersonii]